MSNVAIGKGCTAVHDTITDNNFSQELVFSSRKFGRFSVVAGANYYHSRATVFAAVNDFPFGAFPVGDLSRNYGTIFQYEQAVKIRALGVFLEGNYELTDALTLIAGVRYSDERKSGTLSRFFGPSQQLIPNESHPVTPRISLRYALDSHSNIYATFSKGFKSGLIPGGDARYIAAQYVGRPDLTRPDNVRPEKLAAYEIGYKTAGHGYSLNFAAFYYDYKDLQVTAPIGQGGTVQALQNAAKARILGIDVDGSFDLTPEFSVNGGLSWLPEAKFTRFDAAVVALPPNTPGGLVNGQAVNITGRRLFKTPEVTVAAGAIYTSDIGGGELSISTNIYYSSELYVEPSYILHTNSFKLGSQISYQPEGSDIIISLWGKNLTNDSAFVSVQATSSAIAIIPGDPREIGATLTFKF